MSVNYMLISIIILAVAIAIPFFTFEKRKPKARHVVMIAVMSALTVVANIICAYTIPLHAGTELVIITGIAFGPQTGFLTGVLSRFVCNFFMGQGVWTPWEMAAWGLLGVLAGIAFYKPELVGYFDDKKEIVRKQATTGAFGYGCSGCMYGCLGTCRIYCIFIYRKARRDVLWLEVVCFRSCGNYCGGASYEKPYSV